MRAHFTLTHTILFHLLYSFISNSKDLFQIFFLFYFQFDFSYKWYINYDALEKHRPQLVSFPEFLKKNRCDKEILLLGGSRSHVLK